jgi:predicted MFS family arabinose efflux permease
MAARLGIGRFVYTAILPPMVEALGLTKSQAGLIASANFGGYLIGALLAATPGLAGSRRLWLLGALATRGATTAAMGLTHSLLAHAKSASGLGPTATQAAATASRHVVIAAARSKGCI